jgi:hypothetical protein
MINDLVDEEFPCIAGCHLCRIESRSRIISEFGHVGGMSVHDLVCQKVLNGIFVSEDAHDNVWNGLRHFHLKAAVVWRAIEDVGINREYVRERYCLPHVMGVSCQLIVPSHLYESVLGFGQLRNMV